MIIDYKKRFNNHTGTCYTQTIKIDKWVMEKYNDYILKLKRQVENNYRKTRVYSSYDLKIKSLEYIWVGTNYTNLIHLDAFLGFINELNKQGYNFDFKRILYRNTIIKVI